MLAAATEALIELGLQEDLPHGDVTTASVVPPDVSGSGIIVAREPLVVSGLEAAAAVFRRVDPQVQVELRAANGDRLERGGILIALEGPLASILTAERLALNFLGRLCGVATQTQRFLQAMGDAPARLVDTRKTTPGLRALEKAAVRHGGGFNHRSSLSDGILIKDNHVAAAGGVRTAIARARAQTPHHLVRIEVEVDSLEQLEDALESGAEAVLLDNMSPDQLEEAVRRTRGRAILEASGGVTLETVARIARTGVDLISAGALIHAARWVDVSLDIVDPSPMGGLDRRIP